MKLTELKPQWIKYERVYGGLETDNPRGFNVVHHKVEQLAEATGIMFVCPKCHDKDGHRVICHFEDRVPEDAQPGPGRWNPTGTGFHDLSFVPGKKTQSIQLIGGCNHHFFITNGDVHE